MTIPINGGNFPPISMSDINSDITDGFSLGNNLSAYRGQIYHQKSDGSVGLFSTGSISIGDFYGRRRVDAGSLNDTTAKVGTYTVPPYRTISFVLRAGSGGGGGGGGGTNDVNNCAGVGGNNGSAGGRSLLGTSGQNWYLYCDGGGNGTGGTGANASVSPANGTNGSDAANYDTSLSRASAGSLGSGPGGSGRAGGSGGRGGKLSTVTFTNPVLGGSGPTSGSSLSLEIGAAGGGGGGGAGGNWQVSGNTGYPAWQPIYSCARNTPDRNGGNGGDGAGGYLTANWT